jgi:hypothetical protein
MITSLCSVPTVVNVKKLSRELQYALRHGDVFTLGDRSFR